MGQYHRLVNITKKEFVDPWAIGGSGKHMEHLWNRKSLQDALYCLVIAQGMISEGAGMYPDPICWADGREIDALSWEIITPIRRTIDDLRTCFTGARSVRAGSIYPIKYCKCSRT